MSKEHIVRQEVRKLLREGVYHQDDLFARLYPTYFGHYSVLRNIISEEKNNG